MRLVDTKLEQQEAAQSGDDLESSFHSLFQSNYRSIHRFFEKRGFRPEECADLTQETFIRVYKGIESFRGEASVESWLFQIAANIFRNALRNKSAQKRAGHHLSIVDSAESGEPGEISVDVVGASPEPDPLTGMISAERKRVLQEAVDSLPRQMQRCMMLRVYHDLSYSEIAVVMRISVETVKAHLFQGRKQLKASLSPYFEGQGS